MPLSRRRMRPRAASPYIISLGYLWVTHPNNEQRRLHGAAWGAPQQRGGALTEPSRGHGGGVLWRGMRGG